MRARRSPGRSLRCSASGRREDAHPSDRQQRANPVASLARMLASALAALAWAPRRIADRSWSTRGTTCARTRRPSRSGRGRGGARSRTAAARAASRPARPSTGSTSRSACSCATSSSGAATASCMTRTRSSGRSIGNVARARIANRARAALFLRIHADGSTDRSRHGTSMLYPAHRRGWTDDVLPESLTAARAAPGRARRRLGSRDLGLSRRADLTGFNWSDVPVVLAEVGLPVEPARGPAAREPRLPAARGARAGARRRAVHATLIRKTASNGSPGRDRRAARRPTRARWSARSSARSRSRSSPRGAKTCAYG